MTDSIFFDEIGSLDKYPWGFWNDYKHRELAAKQCHSKEDYRMKFPAAHCKTYKTNGEIDKFQDMFFNKKTTYPKGYWNSYENRLNAAKNCKTQKEYFEKYPGSYDKSARTQGEMQFFRDTIFEQIFMPHGYWDDFKNREKAASECHSKTEFAQKYPVAYRRSRENIEEFNSYIKRFFDKTFVDDDSKIYLIYVYLDYELMIGYCGLTRQSIGMRDCQHRAKDDRLYKLFVNRYKTIIPEPIVVEQGLNRIEAQEKEDYYKQYYSDQGFLMLNSAKTGANISSIGYTFKYNKEQCLKCAKCCKSIKEFRKTYPKEYYSALQHEWLDDYEWLEKEKFKKDITYEECKELAKTCNSISEFDKKYPSEVITARKNKWLYDFFGTPVSWTYEVCFNEAKKYKTRKDFKYNCKGAYVASINNKWIDDFTWLEYKEAKQRTFETFLEEVLKYNSLKDLRDNDYGTYEALSKRTLLEEFFDESGNIKEFINHLAKNDDDYISFKQTIDNKIQKFLQNWKQKRKK